MTKDEAIDFLERGQIEQLLGSLPKGEVGKIAAVLVSRDVLGKLFSDTEAVPVWTDRVELSTNRETNLKDLTSTDEVVIGTVNIQVAEWGCEIGTWTQFENARIDWLLDQVKNGMAKALENVTGVRVLHAADRQEAKHIPVGTGKTHQTIWRNSKD